ncbi:CRTAC1 family protein [Candidatus Poribacteria bacterium]|nr:CRTAC1 family protein [Candidatus Poribacteria bacterium]
MKYIVYYIWIISILLSLVPIEETLTQDASTLSIKPTFSDITKELGIHFIDVNGESGKKFFIEPLGRGVALFDFDNDDDLDLYLVNGSDLPVASENGVTNELYRNDNGKYIEVTDDASVGDIRYGNGCCVGDYNNDGFNDLYVTNYGKNILYKNNGDGTFTDITDKAGVGGSEFSSGCAFLDYDADGHLDLYVVNYVQFDTNSNPKCTHQGILVYCTPEALNAEADILYRNNGDGTFTDVTIESGIIAPPGKGLGVVCGDLDNDGDVDIFIANDTTPDMLYYNNGDGTFTEDGLFSGVALSEEGRPYSGMGANLGDYDNDGFLDIIITNFQDQVNNIYHNEHEKYFKDVSYTIGIGAKSLPYLAWGVDFADFNNDGWLDIFVANGHLDDNIEDYDPVGTYAQPNQLFMSLEGINFEAIDMSLPPKVSRGTAIGDIDNDGDMDIVVTNLKNSPTVILNENGNSQNWITVKLVGKHCAKDAIGARVSVMIDDITQIREVKSGSGYLSQNDMRLHFGLGNVEKIDLLTVRWICGHVQTLKNVNSNQFISIQEDR